MKQRLKQCKKCKKIKDINNDFYFKNEKPMSWCRECIKQKSRRYRKDNPEKCRERNKKWRLKNIKKTKEYDKKRRELNPEYNKFNTRRWRKKNKSKAAYGSIKNGAKSRNIKFDITYKEYLKFSNSSCFYCGKSNQFGLDRLDSSNGYLIKNIVTCCKECNFMKQSMNIKEFLKHIETIHKRKEEIKTKE